MTPHSVETVKNCRLNRLFCLGDPCVQLGSGNADQATSHIQPNRTGVIFDHPVNRVAAESVLGGECQHATLLDPAQPTLRCDPDGATGVTIEAVNSALTEALGRCK